MSGKAIAADPSPLCSLLLQAEPRALFVLRAAHGALRAAHLPGRLLGGPHSGGGQEPSRACCRVRAKDGWPSPRLCSGLLHRAYRVSVLLLVPPADAGSSQPTSGWDPSAAPVRAGRCYGRQLALHARRAVCPTRCAFPDWQVSGGRRQGGGCPAQQEVQAREFRPPMQPRCAGPARCCREAMRVAALTLWEPPSTAGVGSCRPCKSVLNPPRLSGRPADPKHPEGQLDHPPECWVSAARFPNPRLSLGHEHWATTLAHAVPGLPRPHPFLTRPLCSTTPVILGQKLTTKYARVRQQTDHPRAAPRPPPGVLHSTAPAPWAQACAAPRCTAHLRMADCNREPALHRPVYDPTHPPPF